VLKGDFDIDFYLDEIGDLDTLAFSTLSFLTLVALFINYSFSSYFTAE